MRTWLLGSLLASVFLGGCNCTMMSCSSALSLELQRDAWTDGAYDVEVTFDSGEVVVCSFDLPDMASVSCDMPIALLDDTLHVQVALPGDPVDAIDLVVLHDGEELFADTVGPVWGDPYAPNGRRCGPTCTSGTAAATIDG